MNLYWCDESKKHLIDMINRGFNLKISKILGLKETTVEYYLYDYHINDTRCWQDKPFAILGAM